MEGITNRYRIKSISDDDKRSKVISVLSELVFDETNLKQMIDTFEAQIELANSTNEEDRKKTDLFWENTFVRRLLDGTENGTYIGIDLGGTNLRIVRVDMKDGEATTETKYYELTDPLLAGPCSGIFEYIATSLQAYISEGKFDSTQTIPVGFTFSFPSVQKSLKKSILTTWTKRFTCPDGPGEDSVEMLEKAIKKIWTIPQRVEVVARISDTTGTLLAGDLMDKNCRIGLIVGTGSNAAFVEYTKNIEKWDQCYKDDDPSDLVVINSEFGAFGDNGCLDFLRTSFFYEVDKHSPHPGSFTFEKHFSGLYLGELVRLALIKLTEEGLLFRDCNYEKLKTRWEFPTSNVTDIESDTVNSDNTKNVLKDYGVLDNATEEDIMLVREVCDLMSQRGAYIVATAMVVLLNHINLPEVTIGVDGSLYERHPKYHQHMMDIISKWRPTTKTTIILVKDGSGLGGALAAAIDGKRTS